MVHLKAVLVNTKYVSIGYGVTPKYLKMSVSMGN